MSWVAAGTAAAVVVGGLIQSDSASSAANKQGAATDKAIAQNDRQFGMTRSDLAPYRSSGQAAISELQKQLGIGLPSRGIPSGPTAVLRGNLAFRSDTGEYLGRFGMGDSYGQTLDQIAPTWGVNAVIDENGNPSWTKPGLPEGTAGSPGVGAADSPLLRKFTLEDFQNDPVTKASFDFGMSEGEKAVQRMFGSRGLSRSGAAVKAATRFATDYTGTKAGESQQRFVADQSNTFNKLAAVSGIGQTSTTTTGTLGANSATTNAGLLTAEGNARGAAAIARGNATSGSLNTISNNAMGQFTLDRILSSRQPSTTTPTTQPQLDV